MVFPTNIYIHVLYLLKIFLYLQLIEHVQNDGKVSLIERHCPEDNDWKSVYHVYKGPYKIPCDTKLQEF